MTPSKSTSLYLNNFVSDLVDTTSSPFLPGNRERTIFSDSKFRATSKILQLPIEHSTIPNGVRCVIADLEIPPWPENAIGSLFTRPFTPSSGLFTVAWYRSRYKKEGWRCTRGILQFERCLLASLRSDRDFIRIVLVLASRRIVKLARSARDRALKFRVARYAIERTGFPGIRSRIDGEITARNRERILTDLITVNGNGRHRIGNCRQFWQRFCIVFRRLRGGLALLRNIITMMADYL